MFEIKKSIIFIVAILFINNSIAQDASPYRKVKHRFSIGPVISFYKNNSLHTINTKAKSGFNAAYKSEIILDRKIIFLAGLEYMSQGCIFHGYYSAPNHTYLFDKTFSYVHEIRYQEIQLPIALKIAFNEEKNNSYTSYFFLGTGFRYIYKSTAFIQSDSTEQTIYEGKTELTFENHIIDKHFNAFLLGGWGVQKNFKGKGSAVFFEFTYKYSISRLHYVGYQNSNNLNIRDANLTISVGLRF